MNTKELIGTELSDIHVGSCVKLSIAKTPGVAVTDVAKSLHVTRNSVYKLFKSDDMPLKKLVKIAGILDTSIEDILGISGLQPIRRQPSIHETTDQFTIMNNRMASMEEMLKKLLDLQSNSN